MANKTINPDEARIRLIEIYSNALANAWGYYFAVLVGTVALVASLLGANDRLDYVSGLGLAVMILIFGCVHLTSIRTTSESLKSVVSEISDWKVKKVFEGKYEGWSIRYHVLGWLATAIFIVVKTLY